MTKTKVRLTKGYDYIDLEFGDYDEASKFCMDCALQHGSADSGRDYAYKGRRKDR